jgi:hypothetical protein
MTKKHVADLLLSISTRAVARQTWGSLFEIPRSSIYSGIGRRLACGRPKGGIVGAGNPCSDLPWLAALALFGPVQRLTAQSDWAALLQTAKSRKTPHDLCLVVWLYHG